MNEADSSDIENEETVGASLQVTEANVEISATEKQEEIQLNGEIDAPKSEIKESEAVSTPLDTPTDDTQTSKATEAEPTKDDIQTSPAEEKVKKN